MKCNNPNCNFEVSGSCIEGLSSEECENLSKEIDLELISPEFIEGESSSEEISRPVTVRRQLLGQKPLTEQDAVVVFKANYGKVVSFVGPVGVGKTTLISSLYDVFNRDHTLSVTFARSSSIYAFEKLCHSARVTSKGTEISTPRTSSSGGVGFYHISIMDNKLNPQEILFADRSGESYSEMLNDSNLISKFIELKRSDLVCVLVDSSLLGDRRYRHKTRRQTVNFLKSVTSHFNQDTAVPVVLLLTKYDLVEGDETEELCLSEVKRIEGILKSESLIDVTTIPLAARPSLEEKGKPNGIKELWSVIEFSMKPQVKKPLNCYRSERSFHNLELYCD